jgi:hypothetical protein
MASHRSGSQIQIYRIIQKRLLSVHFHAHVLLQTYLSKFGYLHPRLQGPDATVSQDVMKEPIIEFQAFAGINITVMHNFI